MLLWLLLILAPGRQPAGALPKALLLLKPPWSTAFKGETVTLFCKDHHSLAWEYVSWYHNETPLRRQSGKLQISKSGHYRCKTQRSSLSDPVHVQFLSDWLVLQASHPAFERDKVVLRCRGKEEEDIMERTYYKNEEKIRSSYNSNITVYPAFNDDSTYHCTASGTYIWGGSWTETSRPLKIQVQELFPSPVLTASPSWPIEGSPMTLTCETWLPPQTSHTRLQFCFFKEHRALGAGWSHSPELQIPTTWSEGAASYWCQARTVIPRILKTSPRSQIRVHRVPVSDVNLETQPPVGQLIEGEDLVLICSVAAGTGTVTFSWHREGSERSLGRKTQNALSAELRIASVREQDAGRYYCAADNMDGPVLSKRIRITLRVPVSHPVLTLNPDVAQAMVGDVLELRCEAQRGSPPILYWFYHEDVILGNTSAPFGGGASFNLSLTTEHSGNYSCGADNGLGAQSSEMVSLNITVPASRPVLTVRTPRAQAVEGDVVELRCEAQRGSPPILYRFYREDVPLESSSAPSGGGTSFYLSLTTEHSGNYSCEADNGLGAQRSEVVPLSVIVPVSHPTLTLRAPGAQAKVGDMVELRCEAQRGSPPIWYRFYHEDVPLGNSSAPSGGGASLNLSLTAEHSGNYSCEADNGLGARRSEAVPLSMSGLTGSRSGPIATGVTGGLFSTLGFGVVALLLYCRLPRKAGGRPTSDPSRSPADSDVREPVYRNAPAWLELQPVYSNVNPKGGEVVYSEVRRIPQGSKPAANSDSVLGLLRTHLPSHGQAASHRPSDPPGSSVIYSQVKVACPSACVAPQS
ncbi:Fc receptor-like protein 3 isoform X4 [Herpailurus yagouaroundi]|uniref:Fc receptor-like protein 3 isoform X4 n=1 Tax=Herpailurus yagouaroundi TaxID=1608482 RepID=UPI001AD6B4BF|nr:Fc receptor-like protein 3 isoform X4 [Puma yagouaroundi]